MVSRIILAIVGVILVVVGVVAGAAAVWGYTAVGSDGLVRIPVGTVTPGGNARATIIDVDTFSVTAPYIGGLGSSELEVTSPGATADEPLFIGAAATADADAFLAGVPYVAAFRDGGDWIVREVPGGLAAPSPASGRWLTQASGTAPGIVVPDERPLSLVVLAPAGNPIEAFDLAVAFTIPDASTWLMGLAIAAGILIVLGAVLLFLGLRRRRARGRHAAGAAVVASTQEVADDEAPTDVVTEEEVVEDTVAEDTLEDVVVEDVVVEGASSPPDPDITAELPAVGVVSAPGPDGSDVPVDGIAFVIDVDEPGERDDDGP